MDVVKLREYLDENEVSCAGFAQLLNGKKLAADPNVSPSMVDRWKKGEVPRARARQRIFEATSGQVSSADWLGDDLQPFKRKSRDPKVSVAASRKAASTVRRRRQQEART